MSDSTDGALQQLRIVLGALMAGLLSFAAISLAIGPLSPNPEAALQFLLLAVLGLLCVTSAVAYRVLRQQTEHGLRARAAALRATADPAQGVVAEYRRLFILRAVLTDGPGIFGIIVHLLTGHPFGLVVGAAALVLLASQMPSREKLRALAERVLSAG